MNYSLNYGARDCTQHRTLEEALKKTILSHINAIIKAYNDSGKLANLTNLKRVEKKDKTKPNAEQLQNRCIVITNLIKRVFEQNASGVLDDQSFTDLMAQYQAERTQIERRLSDVSAIQNEEDKRVNNGKEFANIIAKYTHPLDELTREVLFDLIEKIVVHEPEGPKRSKYKKQEIEIVYRFVGILDDVSLQSVQNPERRKMGTVHIGAYKAVMDMPATDGTTNVVYYDENGEVMCEQIDTGWSKTEGAIWSRARCRLSRMIKERS
ncbi:hypothetical protein AGMMS49992_21210 [Clostridia bacterium]|nr:hypothetical protein AGMMS49992_21210 [Clostridia bacterium]